MTTQTIAEYLDEERQKATANQLRTEEEAARIQSLQRGHHRREKQHKLKLVPPIKAASKKEKKTTRVAGKKLRATKKRAVQIRKRA